MKDIKDILAINPGSTSTKIAVYTNDNREVKLKTNIVHDEGKILDFPSVVAQKKYRSKMILDFLKSENYDVENLSCIVGRGGMLKELEVGGYLVTETLTERLKDPKLPQHASTLGAFIAFEIAQKLGVNAYIYDAPLSCKLQDVAKITGMKEIERYGAAHVLNQRAMAMEYANEIGKKYEDLNLIVCHMGGGITVSAQSNADIIDTVSYDDGPMSPERSGGVPLLLLSDLIFNNGLTKEEVNSHIIGKGGLYSHLGTKNCIEVEERINKGDEYAKLVYEAMAYQVAKGIAMMTVPLKGKIDAIIVTGGIAHSKMLTQMISEYCGHLGKIVIKAGENEMEALANGAYRMESGTEIAKEYVAK